LYQRGLDADDLAEAFYQGLMRCHAAAGRTADATATYLRLKQLLSVTFGLKPSATTERLYQSLHAG
jgi:LuxR family transcriptional regulator, maltose regulon positive regulatory protein